MAAYKEADPLTEATENRLDRIERFLEESIRNAEQER